MIFKSSLFTKLVKKSKFVNKIGKLSNILRLCFITIQATYFCFILPHFNTFYILHFYYVNYNNHSLSLFYYPKYWWRYPLCITHCDIRIITADYSTWTLSNSRNTFHTQYAYFEINYQSVNQSKLKQFTFMKHQTYLVKCIDITR